MNKRDKYKPAVPKIALLFLAGCVWVCVGSTLLLVAFSWLSAAAYVERYVLMGAGVVVGLLVHHFGFLKIADYNVARILPMGEKRCLFSFMPWKSYLIIPVMIAVGAILRHSAIPKQYLVIMYTGIGLALLLSSVRYVRVFLREIRRRTSSCQEKK